MNEKEHDVELLSVLNEAGKLLKVIDSWGGTVHESHLEKLRQAVQTANETVGMNLSFSFSQSCDQYDAIEIHRTDQPGEVDSESCAVYVHLQEEGGLECVGDFSTPGVARWYACELAKQYGWKIFDYLPDSMK